MIKHSANSTKVLRSENLVKKYKKRAVVKNVSIDVRRGEVVGLLGPNGAGKTTTFFIIVGMIAPNEGRVYLDSLEITAIIKNVVVFPAPLGPSRQTACVPIMWSGFEQRLRWP